jgi:hypothetical protein
MRFNRTKFCWPYFFKDLKSLASSNGIKNPAEQFFYRIYLPTHRINKSTYIGLATTTLAGFRYKYIKVIFACKSTLLNIKK